MNRLNALEKGIFLPNGPNEAMQLSRIPLPSFFVLGAQKAGTTALHRWLAQQPSACLPERKETHFFSHRERFTLGLDWYLGQFRNRGALALYGEVDPEYIFFPEASRRMKDLGLSPRFVVVVREPLRRAYSHYRMSLSRGLEDLPFGEALRQEESRLAGGRDVHLRHHSYMARGRYAAQIARYRDVFPESRLLVVLFEDLFDPHRGAAEFQRLCSFLGFAGAAVAQSADKRYNPASAPRFGFLNELIWSKQRWGGLRQCVQRLIPSRNLKYRIARFLDRLNQRAAPSDHDWLAEVDDIFLEQVNAETKQLMRATGLDLTNWIRD